MRIALDEPHAQADLRAAGIAEAAAQRAVEVEQQGADGGVDEVVGVRHVEHLQDRLERRSVAEREAP